MNHRDRLENAELCQLLVYLEGADGRRQIARTLRHDAGRADRVRSGVSSHAKNRVDAGTSPPVFHMARQVREPEGREQSRRFHGQHWDAVATLSDSEKVALKQLLDPPSDSQPVAVAPARPFVRNWKLDELALLVEKGLNGRDLAHGRTLFGEAKCFACHRFANEGGARGPDLTGAAGRFSVRDLLESIIEPNKVISDQYAAVTMAADTTANSLPDGS